MSYERPELDKSKVVEALPKACSDETAAVELFESLRWGDCPTCPHCSSKGVYKITGRDGSRNKRFLWRCRECGEQFTVRIGTVYEDSRLPLRHWAYAFWRASSSKKGVAAREIERHCQISYKSALFLMHRIRFALASDAPQAKLGGGETGTVECDETFVGGKPRHGVSRKHWKAKIPVVAMVERGGDVRPKVIASVNTRNLKRHIVENVAKYATINTDQYFGYDRACETISRHDRVKHSAHEYARHNADGTVSHVNSCESFFSLLKRGLGGIFHSVSKEHLHRYVSEFEFRWNTRRLNDGDRVTLAIQNATGKRLRYYSLLGRDGA